MSIGRLVWYVGGPLALSGGGERLLFEGLRHLEQQDVETALFADGSPIDREHLFGGRYAPATLTARRHRWAHRAMDHIPRLRLWLRAIEDARAIAAFRPDWIIANSERAATAVLRMRRVGRLGRIPFACFIHGSRYQFNTELEKYAWVFRRHFRRILEGDPVYRATVRPQPPPTAPWRRLRLEMSVRSQVAAVRRAAVVFVHTQKNRAEVELLYGHRNVRVTHGAFPRDIFAYRQRADVRSRWGLATPRVLLSVCRLEAKKQVDLLVRAFALLHAQRHDVGLVIGGTGPERGRLEALARDLGVGALVTFTGFVPDDELYDHYLSADVFANADIADYDITTLVALALGRRAVASSQHEFDPEIDRLGLLFRAAPTVEGFAAAFEAALAPGEPCDPQQRAERLDGYTWEAYFRSVKDAMEESGQAPAMPYARR